MKRITKLGLMVMVFCHFSLVSMAEFRLPFIISDGMVLQQQSHNPIWGWASKGEIVSVKGSWEGSSHVRTKTDDQGKWILKIKTPAAGGPYTIAITINNREVRLLKNVMIGEVFICSGQSNMEMPLAGWPDAPIVNATQEIKEAHFPEIRLFTVERNTALEPMEDCNGLWSECNPASAASFSAVAYFFGRQLYEKLKVPIGLIHSGFGGSVIEAWTSSHSLRKLGDFNNELNKLDSLRFANKDSVSKNQSLITYNTPSVLYNGMIAPLIPYGVRGVIWYQGENNVERPVQYARLFPALIADWRSGWGQGDFPFYFVQIAPFPYAGDGTQAAILRDAQRRALRLPNTGMVVTLDIGDTTNVHPANKKEIGRRLSLWALSKVYQRKDIPFSGPLYKSLKVKGNKMILSFDFAKDGLITKRSDLTGFEIAGTDGNFVPAKVDIVGSKLIVYADSIIHPIEVRYAWSDKAMPNLFNKMGLPASTFRTGKLSGSGK